MKFCFEMTKFLIVSPNCAGTLFHIYSDIDSVFWCNIGRVISHKSFLFAGQVEGYASLNLSLPSGLPFPFALAHFAVACPPLAERVLRFTITLIICIIYDRFTSSFFCNMCRYIIGNCLPRQCFTKSGIMFSHHRCRASRGKLRERQSVTNGTSNSHP